MGKEFLTYRIADTIHLYELLAQILDFNLKLLLLLLFGIRVFNLSLE